MRGYMMTFDENYGSVPTSLLTLMRTRNVSPADYFGMEVCIGEGEWERIIAHIRRYTTGRSYNMPFPWSE